MQVFPAATLSPSSQWPSQIVATGRGAVPRPWT
eukprot:CAMPEP_0195057518 /NCGR_PEP_ID=MMETSP0448-20130528/5622_1 /TAXON_ID=66468 /ORGANISM="Heterocapsa triquestra, Strain CCMP 448" /LENGTH=32 /DNA_ID= /DNA_START= /DNA_END= /DNA_ORIENTATION=